MKSYLLSSVFAIHVFMNVWYGIPKSPRWAGKSTRGRFEPEARNEVCCGFFNGAMKREKITKKQPLHWPLGFRNKT